MFTKGFLLHYMHFIKILDVLIFTACGGFVEIPAP